MPQIKISNHPSIDLEAIRKLLDEADCILAPENDSLFFKEKDELVFELKSKIGTDGDEAFDLDTILVILTKEICADDNVEEIAKQAINGQNRLIAIWPKENEGEIGLPPAFRKYATSVIQWNADELARVICSQETIHKNPDGTTYEAPNTDRNCS